VDLNILIVEDMFEIRKILAGYVYHLPFVKSVQTAKNAEEMFIKLSEDDSINALILDLNLGADSLDGITAYNLCREYGYDIPAIIVTGETLHAAQSYTIGIADVVTKAIDFKRFKLALERLKNYYQYKRFIDNGGACIPICGNKSLVVYPSEIIYVSSEKGKVNVYTSLQEKPYPTNLRLNVYASLLEEHNFIYIHRSFIVNLKEVVTIEGNDLVVSNGDRLPISEDKMQYTIKMVNNFSVLEERKKKRGFLGELVNFVKNI
jgi:DNA-binding LytR/AlgR family response regulator